MNTFECEEELPKLPVPSLEDTIQQVLDALKPLCGNDEYGSLVNEASEILDNEYVQLVQQHLVSAAKSPKLPCYLSSISEDGHPGIYGELRGDILPRNPYLVLEEDPYSKTINPPNQVERAASLINSSLKFIISLRKRTLKPDTSPKSKRALTMSCYDKLFGTARIPADSNVLHNPIRIQSSDNLSRHIIVISSNQYYFLEVVSPPDAADCGYSSKIWFSDHELSVLLDQIIEDSNKADPIECAKCSVGSITTQNYTLWKLGIDELKKSNPEIMKLIDNALFLFILDSSSPETDQDQMRVIAHGTSALLPGTNIQVGSCTSRWYDKLQLIVTKNSVAGLVWDSTTMDSTAILRYISDIYTDSVLKFAKDINGSEYTLFDNSISFVPNTITKPGFKKLNFQFTPELSKFIHLSETRLADLINQHENKVTMFRFNSHLIEKFGLSVDSLLQVAFQVANYSLYGRVANTIEPVTTRRFRDARTDLIAVQDSETLQLARMFITDSDSDLKWEKFHECCGQHKKKYLKAMNGKGFERHITTLTNVFKRQQAIDKLNELNKDVEGLKKIPNLEFLKNLVIPFLSNPVIEKISSPELLISNCGNPAVKFFGMFPATESGFGIGYVIHVDKILITVSSKYRQTERFLDTFKQILKDFRSTLSSNSDFLINISDSKSRKLELQRLRVEQELKHINLSSVSTKHPIKLSPLSGVDSFDGISGNIPVTVNSKSPPSANSNASGSDSNDYDLLGGYGYFSFGDLNSRSQTLSRVDSFYSSVNNSLMNSRNHSTNNLQRSVLDHTDMNDLTQKLSMSADIRDKLSQSEDSSCIEIAPKSSSNDQKKKKLIGRTLDLTNM